MLAEIPQERVNVVGRIPFCLLIGFRMAVERHIGGEPYGKSLKLCDVGKGSELFACAFVDRIVGNAIDNAIECVSKYQEPSKRIISLRSHRQGNIIKVHIENTCTEPVLWKNDLPQTSKHDRENHGYGVRSMRYIVQKYGGHLRFSQNLQASLFNTDILFPLK